MLLDLFSLFFLGKTVARVTLRDQLVVTVEVSDAALTTVTVADEPAL